MHKKPPLEVSVWRSKSFRDCTGLINLKFRAILSQPIRCKIAIWSLAFFRVPRALFICFTLRFHWLLAIFTSIVSFVSCLARHYEWTNIIFKPVSRCFCCFIFSSQTTITYRFFGFLQKKLATGQTVFPFPLNGLSVLALLPCADRSRRCCAHRGVPSLRSEARLYAWLFPVHGKPRAVRQEKRCGKNE